jgi:hypothetical protein
MNPPRKHKLRRHGAGLDQSDPDMDLGLDARLLRQRVRIGLGRLAVSWYIGAVALVAATGAGCKGCDGVRSRGDDEMPSLGKVTVTPVAANVRGAKVALDTIPNKVRERVAGSGVFAVAPTARNNRPTANVSITVEILGNGDEADSAVRVRLRVEIRPAGSATARFAEDAAAVGQAPLDEGATRDLAAAYQRLAERTTDDLVSAYLGRQKLWLADESGVAGALASSDADQKVEAIRIVGVKKLRRNLPTIVRLLSDEDEAIRDAALGAVVALGDRSAIKALAESHQMRNTYEMRKVIDAVGSLGGQEARDYLSFVSDNHDDSDIREMAKAALERLVKREPVPSPTR